LILIVACAEHVSSLLLRLVASPDAPGTLGISRIARGMVDVSLQMVETFLVRTQERQETLVEEFL